MWFQGCHLVQMVHVAVVHRLKRTRHTGFDDFSSDEEAQADSDDEDSRSDVEDNQSNALDTLEQLDGDLTMDHSDLLIDQEWIMLPDGQVVSSRIHAAQSAAMSAQYAHPYNYARIKPRDAWHPSVASNTAALTLTHPSLAKWFRPAPSSRLAYVN